MNGNGLYQLGMAHQLRCVSDCEGDEHDGSEPDVDDEPSLCGSTAGDGATGDGDLDADLGSFDRMTDQRKSLRTVALCRSVQE
jgi:hypothetical protein